MGGEMKNLGLIFLGIFLWISLNANAQVWKEGKPLYIAHRGARALVDENTIEALKKAIEIGVDAVEFDIQRTKDGVYVLLHDSTVNRTTNGKGKIAEMELAEFKKLKTKSGYTLPTLEETLAFLKETEVGIILDIKVKDPNCISEIHSLAEKYGLVERSVFESSYPKVAKAIEEFKPELLSAIYPPWPPSAYHYAKKYNLDCVSLFYPFANSWEVERAKKAGFKVVVWTVNKPKLIKRFEEKRKVDGIMTDDPRLFEVNNNCGCRR